MARPVTLLVALLLGACATPNVPPAPAPPPAGWTYRVTYENQGYREDVRGPRFDTAEAARRALTDLLRGQTDRPLRARVVEIG